MRLQMGGCSYDCATILKDNSLYQLQRMLHILDILTAKMG